ncbi:hypothetical protein EVAR_14165_1 [Eumeta japonica]|uniref:Uncharacterized protein n=1 Tax=Eumeta variegata TaxID=151549 RepID=A0A4C1UFT0_EUMVA|nr:hypothetical protein EVAR_14165_1 [Eumeta japonica]
MLKYDIANEHDFNRYWRRPLCENITRRNGDDNATAREQSSSSMDDTALSADQHNENVKNNSRNGDNSSFLMGKDTPIKERRGVATAVSAVSTIRGPRTTGGPQRA